MSPRIWTSGAGGSGGLTQAEADLLYVKIAGDVMTGSLQMGTNTSPQNLLMQGTEGNDSGNSGFVTFAGKDSSLNDITGQWYLAWTPAESFMRLQAIDSRFATDNIIELYSSGTETGLRIQAQTYPRFDASYSLGNPSNRWQHLYLSGSIKDGALGETLDMDTDGAYDLADTSKGLRQVIFADTSSGSNRGKFRGNKCIGYANADIYWGVDDVFPGYFVQKTVVAGSTATDNSQDYTNLYQGDSAYQFIALNFAIGRTVDANGNPTNGINISDSGPGTLGCPLVFKAGTARLFELYLDQTNTVFRMECGKTTTTRIPKLEIRLAGTGPAIRPYSSNLIDFGESALLWKDGYFAGDVRQRQAIATGDNAGVASTVSLTNASDTSANSTGVGTVLMKGTTLRNSVGFLKLYNGTTAVWVPYWTTVTG